jgi:hypothetical protein
MIFARSPLTVVTIPTGPGSIRQQTRDKRKDFCHNGIPVGAISR